MLFKSSRWHNAANGILSEESRLLRFASTPTDPQNPDSSPESNPDSHAEATSDAADRLLGETREGAEHVLNSESQETVELPATVESAKEAVAKLKTEIAAVYNGMREIDEKVFSGMRQGELPEDFRLKKWEPAKQELLMHLGHAKRMETALRFAEVFEQLKRRPARPVTIVQALHEHLQKLKDEAIGKNEAVDHLKPLEEAVEKLDAWIVSTQGSTDPQKPDLVSRESWERLSDEEKQKAYDRMGEAMGTDVTVQGIYNLANTTSKNLETKLEKTKLGGIIDTLQGKLHDGHSHDHAPQTPWELWKHIAHQRDEYLGKLGIELYTPMQIYHAFESLAEAIKEAHHHHDQLKSSILATGLGRLIEPILALYPGMEGVQVQLENAEDKKNEDIKNGFKEALKATNRQPVFRDIFDPGGLLDQYHHDKNHALAILEYAAEKGMLYGIEHWGDDKNIFGNHHWNLGSLVPSSWNTKKINQYWDSLVAMQGNGATSEIEAGRKLAEPLEEGSDLVDLFVNKLEDEGNLYLAIGIAERAFEKGKFSEMSAILGAIMMGNLRRNPLLRQYMSIEALSRFGKITAYSPTPTSGYLHFERMKVINHMRKNAQVHGSISVAGAGTLGRLYEQIHRTILSRDPSLDPKGNLDKTRHLDRLIAQVMAAQSIELPNRRAVTLFEPQFNWYNFGSGKQRSVAYDKLDDDFYGTISELMIADASVIKQILGIESTGPYKDPGRARYLLNQVLMSIKQLEEKIQNALPEDKANLQAALVRFKQTMGSKLDLWVESTQGAERDNYIYETVPESETKSPGAKVYVLIELIKKGVINKDNITKGKGAMQALHALCVKQGIDMPPFISANKAGGGADKEKKNQAEPSQSTAA